MIEGPKSSAQVLALEALLRQETNRLEQRRREFHEQEAKVSGMQEALATVHKAEVGLAQKK